MTPTGLLGDGRVAWKRRQGLAHRDRRHDAALVGVVDARRSYYGGLRNGDRDAPAARGPARAWAAPEAASTPVTAKIAESRGKGPKVGQRRLRGRGPEIRIVHDVEHVIETLGGLRVVLPIVRGLGNRVLLLDDGWQDPPPHLGERRADARRHIGLARLIPGLDGDHRRDGLLGVGIAAKRQEAERAVLLNGSLLVRSVRSFAQLVEDDQRVFVRRRRVEIARRRQRIVGGGGRKRRQERRRRIAAAQCFALIAVSSYRR